MKTKIKEIPLTTLITTNATAEALTLVKEYGLPYPVSYKTLNNELDYLLKKHGKTFLRELGKIHPDRELILDSNNVEEINISEVKEVPVLGCKGLEKRFEEFKSKIESNFSGSTNTPNQGMRFSDFYPVVVVGGLALWGLALIVNRK